MKRVSTIIIVCVLFMTAQPIYAETYTPEEVQQAVATLLYEIEEAAGLEHEASDAIYNLTEERKKTLYGSVKNKKEYMDSAYKALDRIQSAKAASKQEANILQDATEDTLLALTPPTPPYTPNYPPTYSAAYNIVKTLGLTSSNEDRCDGVGLEIYENIFYAAEDLAAVGDAACSFIGCDPTGVACAIACGVVEGYKLAVLAARIPSDSCNKHNEGVNAAEIEAGYENSVAALNDLSTSLENQKYIMANQEKSLQNQKKIIRLLKTPQGKRPGWNK